MTLMRNTFTAAFGLATAVTLAACSPSTDHAAVTTSSPGGASTATPAANAAERDNALVRFVNAVPAGPTVDVYADDAKAFAAVAYKSVTPFEEVAGERSTIRVRATGATPDTDALASN